MRTGRQDEELSRRERQIMDALYRIGPASAADIRDAIPHPPTYTAVRTHLTLLEEKGLVKHETDGTRYIYEPVVPRDERAKSAIDEVMQTFFDNSLERIVATLIDRNEPNLTPDQLDRLAQIIDQARKEGR